MPYCHIHCLLVQLLGEIFHLIDSSQWKRRCPLVHGWGGEDGDRWRSAPRATWIQAFKWWWDFRMSGDSCPFSFPKIPCVLGEEESKASPQGPLEACFQELQGWKASGDCHLILGPPKLHPELLCLWLAAPILSASLSFVPWPGCGLVFSPHLNHFNNLFQSAYFSYLAHF